MGMRIAFLTNEYPTELYYSGLAVYLQRTAGALIAQGHEAEIFTLSDRTEDITDGSISVHRVAPSQRMQKFVTRSKVLSNLIGGYVEVVEPAFSLARALRRRHRQAPFDVVQAANYRATGLAALFLKVAPVVTRISSFEPLWRDAAGVPDTRAQRQMEAAERWQLRHSTALYAPSRFLADVLQQHGLAVKVIEPPMYMDERFFEGAASSGFLPDTYAIFFGQVGLLKGCDRLVRVLPQLLDRNPDMTFVFVGTILGDRDGRTFDQYIQEDLGRYGSRVVLMSERNHQFLMPLVAGARFVVLPSRIDNLPNTCLEAMALKRVVIGSRTASFEQLIHHGENGFLVSQEDDDELASCMEKVWRMSAAERERVGVAAQHSLDRLSPEKTIKQLLEFYTEAGARPGRTLRPAPIQR